MADMTNIRLELCNRIRMEAEHINDTDFPLEVFPQTMQSVILDMARYENYKAEFIATAMLSAVSAALGGTYRIRIKGEWQSNAALYIIIFFLIENFTMAIALTAASGRSMGSWWLL